MLNARPAHQPQPVQSIQRHQAVRIVASVVAAAFGIGYLINDLNNDVMAGMAGMARALAVVAVVALVQWLGEIRTDRRLAQQDRRLAQIDERIKRSQYWRVYSDVLTDLGGIDGETSTDSGRLPPRP